MAADKEAVGLSRVDMYESKCILFIGDDRARYRTDQPAGNRMSQADDTTHDEVFVAHDRRLRAVRQLRGCAESAAQHVCIAAVSARLDPGNRRSHDPPGHAQLAARAAAEVAASG